MNLPGRGKQDEVVQRALVVRRHPFGREDVDGYVNVEDAAPRSGNGNRAHSQTSASL